MSSLQEKFFSETGISAMNSQGEPDIDYVKWLEARVEKMSSLTSAMLGIALAVRDLCDSTVLDNWAKLANIKERVNAVVAQLQETT